MWEWFVCEVCFFREVEATVDPPSPTLAFGMGVSVRLVVANFWSRSTEATKAPDCRLVTRLSFWV